MTGEPNIDYDSLALDAMRGVVRTVLQQAAKSGLPGDHHFYISFDTEALGVFLSKRLKERYPREMTIVLQHRFWDLVVTDDRFEVKLTFDSIPERLVVPFAAIKVFFDPSVQYGLRFEDGDGTATETTQPPAGGGSNGARNVTTPRTGTKRARTTTKKPKTDRDGLVAVGQEATPAQPVPMNPRSQPIAPVAAAPEGTTPASGDEGTEKPAGGTAQILSLDQFRKK